MNEKYSVEFGSTAESYLRSHIKKGIGAPTTAAVNSFYSYINIYVSCLPPSRVDPESVQANWLFDAACELGDEITSQTSLLSPFKVQGDHFFSMRDAIMNCDSRRARSLRGT